MQFFLRLFLLFLACLATNITFSQKAISLGPQIGFSKGLNIGIGGGLEYTNKFSGHTGFRASLGYTYFTDKFSYSYHFSYIPVRVGLQGYLAPTLFLFADAGVAIQKSIYSSTAGFSYSVGVSQVFPFVESNKFIQASLNYNVHHYSSRSNSTWFNFRLAYGLSWPKMHKQSTEK